MNEDPLLAALRQMRVLPKLAFIALDGVESKDGLGMKR